MSSVSSQNASTASTKTFLTALWVNAAVFGLELLAFTLLRPRFKAIYEPRTYIPPESKRSPPLSSRLLAWPISVWRSDYNDILPQNGMDAYFFVRFLRMVVKILFPIWIISWLVLLPLTSVDTSAANQMGLDKFTFGNIGLGQQPRYAAHLVLTWVFTFWIWYVIRGEMKHFVTARQQYLVSPTYARSAQAHTVLVTGVPTRFLSERAIQILFSHLPGGVKKVWLNRDLKELPDLYDRRLAACGTLESAETSLLKAAAEALAKQRKAEDKAAGIDKKTKKHDIESAPATAPTSQPTPDLATLVPEGDRPTHRLPIGPLPFALPLIGTKVDSITWARKEIADASAALDKGRAVLRRETEVLEAGGTLNRPTAGGGILGFVARKAGVGGGTAKVSGEREKKAGNNGGDAASIVTDGGAEEADAHSAAEAEADTETYPPLNSAFVLFHNQAAAHMAGQLLTHHEPYRMSQRVVGVAPADVIWGNLGLNPYETKVRCIISYAATAGLIICWAFPVAFVGIVSNIARLCTTYKWLAWLCKIPAVPLGIIQGILPPVLLAVLMMLLPIILRLLAKFEGIPRRSDVELSLMTRFFIFQVIHSFLIVTLASGIIAALPKLVANPTSIPSILAMNLPSASTFFLTYVVLQGLSGAASGFLQIVPLIIYYVKLFLMGSTPRSVYKIKYTLRHVSWGTLFPSTTLIVVITIAYSVISPIINGLACFTFILFYYLYKYLFLYQFEQPASGETGGLFFPKAIQHVFVGLYIQQICLAALYFLARDVNNKASAVPEGALMIVLIVFTALFHLMINNSYGPLLYYLPLSLSEKANVDAPEEENTGAHTRALPSEPVNEDGAAEAGPTRQSSRSSYAKRKPAPRVETTAAAYANQHGRDHSAKNSASASGSGDGDADALGLRGYSLDDPERSEKAALVDGAGAHAATAGVSASGSAEGNDFTHPAAAVQQRVVWIPGDALGFAGGEVAACREAGVDASSRGAAMDAKGHVDISGPPPGEELL